MDGMGISSERAWPSLSKVFDLHVLQLSTEHQGSFAELASFVKGFLEQQLVGAPVQRSVYLMGEGFGAVLALTVALECRDLVDRLLLVNPSTSYPTSPLARIGPLLGRVPAPLYNAMPLALAPALSAAGADPRKLAADLIFGGSSSSSSGSSGASSARAGLGGGVSLPAVRPPAEVAADAMKVLVSTIEQLQHISRQLPQRTFTHRMAMLEEGARLLEPRLGDVEQRCMLLIGGRDLVLPSAEEGKRLAGLMQRAFVKLLPDSGHAPLSEPGQDVVPLIRSEGFYVPTRTFTAPPKTSTRKIGASSGGFGSAVPLELPTQEEVRRTGKSWTGQIRSLTSPVFLSTLPDGSIVQGLGGIPAEARPLLVLGNHQLYAQDMNIMVEQVLLERGVLLRGLAHPNLFVDSQAQGSTETASSPSAESAGARPLVYGTTPGRSATSSNGSGEDKRGGDDDNPLPRSLSNTYRTFGAVAVTPQNFYRLLQQGEAVLLYPGGVREGFKRKHEKYELFWPSRPEFVRMAARFSCTVVPLAAIGFEDCVNIVLDSDEIRGNPLLGPRALQSAATARVARVGVAEDADNDQSFIPPIIAPQVPARMYFLFGKPTVLTPDLCSDKVKCQQVYLEMKREVEQGIAYLLRKREQDPYKDFLPRYIYENPPLGGAKRQAPTFTLP